MRFRRHLVEISISLIFLRERVGTRERCSSCLLAQSLVLFVSFQVSALFLQHLRRLSTCPSWQTVAANRSRDNFLLIEAAAGDGERASGNAPIQVILSGTVISQPCRQPCRPRREERHRASVRNRPAPPHAQTRAPPKPCSTTQSRRNILRRQRRCPAPDPCIGGTLAGQDPHERV